MWYLPKFRTPLLTDTARSKVICFGMLPKARYEVQTMRSNRRFSQEADVPFIAPSLSPQ